MILGFARKIAAKLQKKLHITKYFCNFVAFLLNIARMTSPFTLPPHPLAQEAAAEIIEKMHAYMRVHPDSELHQKGKMFGVLVYADSHSPSGHSYLAAFSAMLDGSYDHEGFVPPVYPMSTPPVGTNKAESQRMQRLLFAQYQFINGNGETKNLLDIFSEEKPILSAEQWFSNEKKSLAQNEKLPPSGAGECCAPKLLQYALTHGLQPLALAEFWVGASPASEIRKEGCFYTPCSGKCVPILRHMLQGIEVTSSADKQEMENRCKQIEILFEDDYLMVVNKPAGLLSVPGKNEDLNIVAYLAEKQGHTNLQAAHRLDQDTSGLLVLAKNPEVYKALQAYFQRRDILKRYEAVVKVQSDDVPCPKEGVIDLPLLQNPFDRPRQMVDKVHGKPAITRYVIRERLADGTYFVDFFPLTGRTHQLRVHAAHPQGLNAPIVGDRLYGKPQTRLMLHAAEIRFVHPITREVLHFCVPSHFNSKK